MAPIYLWDDGLGGGAQILVDAAAIAAAEACCCGGGPTCYLLRTCSAAEAIDPNDEFLIGCGPLPIVVSATINGVTRNLVASVTYTMTYGDLGGVCAFTQGLDEWYLTWNYTGLPGDGTGTWQLVNNTAGILMNGPVDTPCDPVGAYTDGGGNNGSIAAGDDLVCEYLCENDFVTNTDLSAEFAAGNIIKNGPSGYCYNIVCAYSCDDGYSGSLYSAGPLTVGWAAYDSCNMCVDLCSACDPPMASSIPIEVGEVIPGILSGLYTLAVGDILGNYTLTYDGSDKEGFGSSYCYWSGYIGYIPGSFNCGGGEPNEHLYWVIRSDGISSSGIMGIWSQCSAGTAEPTNIDYVNGFIFGWFFWGGENCDQPCGFIPQVDPGGFYWARNTAIDLCTYGNNTCNACAPAIQDWFIVEFTGLTGDWSDPVGSNIDYNNDKNMIINAGGGCTWNNDAGGFSGATIVLTWDGVRWVLTLDTSFGGACCIATWYGPTDACNPIGAYALNSESQTCCSDNPGTSAAASTANVKGNY